MRRSHTYCTLTKIYAASEEKLGRVIRSVKSAMADIGLEWNNRKCSVVHVKRGDLQDSRDGMWLGESEMIESLSEDSNYKFLGVPENVKQEDGLALEVAAKVYLKHLSVIWSSPQSDYNGVIATNQFALPMMEYLMWKQTWPLDELQRLNREKLKVICESGGKHPLGSTALKYLPRRRGGRGLKSIEEQYKVTKSAVKIYANNDKKIEMVRRFEEKSEASGRRSLVKDAKKYAGKLDLHLNLQ